MDFKLVAEYKPTGDQPQAIDKIVESVLESDAEGTTLLGVTGSGKTFTIANAIERINRPTLVISHNKTLAAQLYNEFKNFFPENAVEYFVSYYDYYQPEAYLPTTDTYIEKDLSINDEIEKMRLRTVATLLSGITKDKFYLNDPSAWPCKHLIAKHLLLLSSCEWPSRPWKPKCLSHFVAQEGIQVSTALFALGSYIVMGIPYVQN